ncbi:MAG TPA: hypothetical protein PKA33_05795 [Amaricoccus sp.]|uniref:hypothetical protein n=1 Tax=Amaricoccus sp. TaxID=1872485 RepID=UPI002B627DBB|nr:hypothetical protein [Amaricoccus sp.]HMQ94699.1 hypothetical protein [Amaricoccus sp.]HMR52069.1 hypothetical protein [Amaricoccus sp.]HMR62139.1 hypothetical protein [Amaricoccus sp.]HMT98871.1 hypothetical protein [Amaricoccus sp.]
MRRHRAILAVAGAVLGATAFTALAQDANPFEGDVTLDTRIGALSFESGYFRFYGPTEAFFDKSWALPDIEKID